MLYYVMKILNNNLLFSIFNSFNIRNLSKILNLD